MESCTGTHDFSPHVLPIACKSPYRVGECVQEITVQRPKASEQMLPSHQGPIATSKKQNYPRLQLGIKFSQGRLEPDIPAYPRSQIESGLD